MNNFEQSRINSLLPEQLKPGSIELVKFLKEYYIGENDKEFFKSLPENSNYIDVSSSLISNITTNRDLDRVTEQEFIGELAFQVTKGVPESNVVTRKFLIKRLVDYYNLRGNKKMVDVFFRLFFNKSVTVFEPWSQVLIPSNGDFKKNSFIRIISKDGNEDPFLLEGKTIKQVDTNGRVIASGFCSSISFRVYEGETIYSIELLANSVIGTFEYGYEVKDSNDKTYGQVYKTLSELNIVRGGANYQVGDQIFLEGYSDISFQAVVSSVNINGEITGINILDYGAGTTINNEELDIFLSDFKLVERKNGEIVVIDNIINDDIFFAEEFIKTGHTATVFAVNKQPPHYILHPVSDEIVVYSAGTEDVNGTYVKTGTTSSGGPSYTKPGTNGGAPTYLWADFSGYLPSGQQYIWKISFDKANNQSAVILYDGYGYGDALPTPDSWIVRQGVSPAPTVSTSADFHEPLYPYNSLYTQPDGISLYSTYDFTFEDYTGYLAHQTSPTFENYFYEDFIEVEGANDAAVSTTESIIDSSIGINRANLKIKSENGDGAELTLKFNSLIDTSGKYINESGRLSSSTVLQDSDFYQKFSYELQVDVGFSEYLSFYKDLLHPAGEKVFNNIKKTIISSDFSTELKVDYGGAYLLPTELDIDPELVYATNKICVLDIDYVEGPTPTTPDNVYFYEDFVDDSITIQQI